MALEKLLDDDAGGDDDDICTTQIFFGRFLEFLL